MYSTYLLSMAFAGLSLLSMAAASPKITGGIAARAPHDSTSVWAHAPAPTWDPSNNGDDEWKNPDCPDC
ncbi:hypothetical protein E4U52_004308 [Claviceps spartinae]|nr:hypothetical protein E4U52_004308 [Claviceps spartinae]